MRLDHFGFRVGNLELSTNQLTFLGFEVIGSVEDNYDNVELVLLQDAAGGNRVELVRALDGSDAGDDFKWHHLCFESDDFDGDMQKMRSLGFMLFQKPRPAPLFNNKRICWFFGKIGVIELKEA
jgi:catechol 2,3-dioxygenase-like lactoylglutathione lyase family enzyme